jgi:hypothetical protein
VNGADALATLVDDGIRLEIDPAGRLLAGPASRLTPVHRDLLRAHRSSLVALLAAAAPDQAAPSTDRSFRLWSVVLPDGTAYLSSFSPPATREEILTWYPDARVEPVDEGAVGPSTTLHNAVRKAAEFL